MLGRGHLPKYRLFLLTCLIASLMFFLCTAPAYAMYLSDIDVADLIAAMEAANAGVGDVIITLAVGGTYDFPTPYPATPENALPPITTGITVNGNGATLSRTVGAVNNFRFFLI